MRRMLMLLLAFTAIKTEAKFKLEKPLFTGMYFQWGYNRDKYSKSDLHFKNGSEYDFVIHKAVAKDQPNFEAFYKHPIDVTIPQNVYRIGFYLNKKHTHAIEINFDHAKYVIVDSQRIAVSGQVRGTPFNSDDTILDPHYYHFEHTNGANFYFINYVGQHELLRSKKDFTRATVIWKAGAGIVVPKSDILLFGKELDNKYHVAGYIAALEGGLRLYAFRNFFFEATGKGGFANYLNALTVGDGGHISHHFWFGMVVGTFGFDVNWRRYSYKRRTTEKAAAKE